ncbi:hypothetical protein V8E54_006360 [Elaphomyces granulatus]
MATTAVKDIALEGPENYHSWFSNIKGSVPKDLWRYFDPASVDDYNPEPEPVTVATLRPGATSLQQLSAAERTLFAQLRTVYNAELSHYHRYLSEEAKLRNKLINTVPEAKRVLLPDEESIRQWISSLQAAAKPSDVHMKDFTKAKHRSMMTGKFVDWPSVGPEKWLSEWHKLMNDARRWSPALYSDWASDFVLVWGEVPGAKRLCDRLTEAETSGEIRNWDIYKASSELKQAWDQRLIRSGMRITGKGHTTRSVFATDARLDEPEFFEETTDEATEETTHSHPSSRKRVAFDGLQQPSTKRPARRTKTICWGCEGQHNHHYCPLLRGSNPKKIKLTDENRHNFDKKMEDPTFAEKIRKLREADLITKKLSKDAEGRSDG